MNPDETAMMLELAALEARCADDKPTFTAPPVHAWTEDAIAAAFSRDATPPCRGERE